MTKLAGCACILTAALITLWRNFGERSALLDTVAELRAALEDITTAIRWQQMRLPQAIAAQSGAHLTGSLFQKIVDGVQGEVPLQLLWTSTFAALQPPLSDILCRMRLQGDEEHLLRQFRQAAEALERYEAQLRAVEQCRRKIVCATTLSTACILVLLLF